MSAATHRLDESSRQLAVKRPPPARGPSVSAIFLQAAFFCTIHPRKTGATATPTVRSSLVTRCATLLSLLILLSTGCSNFHGVAAGKVYRSAQPTSEQLQAWIHEHGLRTVLRLRGGTRGNPQYDATRSATDATGIELVQIPMSATRYPTRAELLALVEAFATADYPLLIHCRAGADRTGLASAVYLLCCDRDLDAARAQLALRYLHTGLIGSHRLDAVLELYAARADARSFADWVRDEYAIPFSHTVRWGRSHPLDASPKER